MACLLKMRTGDLRVLSEYATLIQKLREMTDDAWIEVQEQNAVQTRHLVRRTAILQVTELFEKGQPASARILG